MKRIQLLTMAMIAVALGAGAMIKSYSSAGLLAAPRQPLPITQPAIAAHSATMPIVVPAVAIEYFAGTGDEGNGSWIRP